jgi:SAM-dependent methyltransferase
MKQAIEPSFAIKRRRIGFTNFRAYPHKRLLEEEVENDPMHEFFSTEYFDERTMASVIDAIHSAHADKGIGGGGDVFDARRIAITIEYIRRHGLSTGFCVEIGSLKYLSSKVIWSCFDAVNLVGTRHDLRRSPMPFPDNFVDNIICTEVIEHISDICYEQATTLSGVFFFLNEAKRVLKQGGRMLITTPNAASLWALQAALLGQSPMMYEWHFREFTVHEMKQIVESIGGLRLVVHNTEFVWHLWNFSHITEFLKQASFSTSARGDDQFIVIEKDDSIEAIPHSLNLPRKEPPAPSIKRRWSLSSQMLMAKARHRLWPKSTIQRMKSY